MYQTLQAAGEAVDKMLTQDAFGAQQCLGFQAILTLKNHGFVNFNLNLVTFPIHPIHPSSLAKVVIYLVFFLLKVKQVKQL